MIPKEQLTTEQLRGWLSLDETAAEAFSLHSLSAFGMRNNIAVLAFRPLIEELIEARQRIAKLEQIVEDERDAHEPGHVSCLYETLDVLLDKVRAAKGGER